MQTSGVVVAAERKDGALTDIHSPFTRPIVPLVGCGLTARLFGGERLVRDLKQLEVGG